MGGKMMGFGGRAPVQQQTQQFNNALQQQVIAQKKLEI
tara:strand:+ start:547 stop:660 length:114 start_codon:yes stop_codon:yes gene_type:complete